jgi:hypothetical protein
MGVSGFAGGIVDERVGEGGGVFGDVETVGIEIGERIEGGGVLADDAEGVENMDLAEALTGAAGEDRRPSRASDQSGGAWARHGVRRRRIHGSRDTGLAQ